MKHRPFEEFIKEPVIWIEYSGKENRELDRELEKLLKKHGYEFAGSGWARYDPKVEGPLREIAFIKFKK